MNNDLSDPVDPDAVGVTSGAPDHAADPGEPERLERLTEIIRSSSWFMELLLAARDVRPPDWLLGGGALRDLVWDRLHGRAQPTPPRDVDLAFFDPERLDPGRDAEVERALSARLPGAPWGLADLLGIVCRRNPRRVTVEEYRRRVAAKRIAERWPGVTIVGG